MKKNNRWARIFLIVVACFSILSLSLSNLAVYGGQIYAEEATPTPTVEASLPTPPQDSPSPTESITPTPTEIPLLSPTPTAEITPTSTPTVELSPTSTPPAEVEITPSPSAVAENLSLPESTQPSPTPTLSQTDSSPPDVSKGSLSIAILSDVSAQSIELNLDSQNEAGSASLTTDKADYAPTDTVVISGTEFLFDTAYTLIISSSDTPAVNFQTEVTTNDQGKFIYAYQLDGNYRPNYKVEIKDSEGKVLATVAFTDSDAIFSDGFESNDFSNWTGNGAWSIVGTGHTGSKSAKVIGNTSGETNLQKTQSTVGYENITLTFWYKVQENLEGNDHLRVEYSIDGGSNWTELTDYTNDNANEWTEEIFNLPSSANNIDSFEFRFRANLNSGSDDFRIDDVSLTGDPISSSCATPPSGMTSWWPADGNANDIAGTNNGTLVGGTTYAGGKVDQAFSFDGTNDLVAASNVGDFGSSPFTVDFWMKSNDNGPGTYIIGKSHANGGLGWDLRLNSNTIQVVGVNGWPAQYNFASDASVTTGVWHHIALTSTETEVSLYIDGILKGTSPRSAISYTSNPFRIGWTTDFGGYAFNGLIDEVEIFDRALSQDEINAIYNADSAGKCKEESSPTGTITIEKVVEGGDVPSSNWSFNILGDQGTVASDKHDGDSVTLPVGTYTIGESTIAGYTLTAVGGVCSDINSPNATLTVTTDGGTCTLTNTQDSDTTIPTVLNVSATDANGTYYTNETVHVTVQFSEPVTVTPYYWFTCTFWGFCPDHYEYPKLQLQLDGQTRWLAYTSGSDTDTLQFDYVVADGDRSDAINYVDTASLIYNSRDASQVTIRDTAGNAADLTLPAVDSEESLDGQKDIAINVTSTARLRAFKYFDVDQNGSYDGEDYPLEGWRISLYNDRGSTYISDKATGADGYTDYWEDVPVEDPNELVLQEDPSVQWDGENWQTREGYEEWVAVNPTDRGGGGYGTYWDGEVTVEAGGEYTFSFGNWQDLNTDTTPPELTSAETMDGDGNGNIDAIRLTFSEDIDDSRLNIGEADGWDVEDPVGGEQIDVGDSSNELILYFGEGPNPDTGNTASFTYTPTSEIFSTHDLDGNELEWYEGVAQDGASPVLLSAFTRDTNANGKIDAIELTFSEDIDDNMLDVSSADGWDVWDYDGEIIGTGEGDSDNRLLLTFDEGVSEDTGGRPMISYSPSEELTSTHDLAGNELAYYEDFASDGAAPISVVNSPETNNIYNSPINISGQSSDASGDTVSYVNLFYRDNPEGEWNEIPDSQQNNEGGEPFEWLYEWTPPSDGTYDIKVEATDDSGNIELSPVVTGIVYDTTAPQTPSADPVAGDYDSDQTVKLSSNDDLSGLDKIYYTTDGSVPGNTKTEYTVEITVDKDLVIKAIAYDKAGNSSGILTAGYGIAPKISGEGSSLVTTSSATITWTTDDPATSRVVYDTVSHLILGDAPNYGYANSTTETDASPKVTSHSVTISGLLAGTTYYYRTVSHGSPEAVGGEKSFKTSTASTPASTTTSTTTSTNGGGSVGDGLSDGLGCGSNDCSGGSAPPQVQVLGVSTESFESAELAQEVLGASATKEEQKEGETQVNKGEVLGNEASPTETPAQENLSSNKATLGGIIAIVVFGSFGYWYFRRRRKSVE